MAHEFPLKSLIDVDVLQHLQASFSEENEISVAIFDEQGRLLIEPSRHCLIPTEAQGYFMPFLEFVLTWPPNLHDLALQDGGRIFSSFFNKLIHRAILPLAAPQKALGAIQLIMVTKNRQHEMAQWRTALEGFSFNYISYLAFLDSYSSAGNDDLVRLCTQFYQKLEHLLEAGLSRLKKNTPSQPSDSEERGDIITTPHHDIIQIDAAVSQLLGYESSAEMLGLNVIDQIIAQPEDRENIRHFLDIKGQLAEYPLYLRDKRGRLQPVKIVIGSEDLGKDVPTGYRYTVQVVEEQDIDKPNMLDLPLRQSTGSASENIGAKRPASPPSVAESMSVGDVEASSVSSLPSGAATAESLDAESIKAFDAMQEALLILDQQNRIIGWNNKIAELLHCPPQAVHGSEFQSLMVGDSQQRWSQMLFAFRRDQESDRIAAPQPFYLVDGLGDLWAITLQMKKIKIKEKPFISAVITNLVKSSMEQAFLPSPPAVQAASPSQLILPVHSPDTRQDELAPIIAKIADHFEKQMTKIQRHTLQMGNEQNLDHPLSDHVLQIKQLTEQTLHSLQLIHYYGRRIRPHLKNVQINELLQRVANMQQALFSNPYQIHFDLQKDVYPVSADPLLLGHALSLLIEMARKTMSDGGVLSLRSRNSTMPATEEKTPAVSIEVSYPACSFSEQMLDHLFEPFGDGQGLELAAVYGIVRSLNGKIDVAADSRHGTRFRIYIAAVADQVTGVEDEIKDMDKGGVLIIDDERGIVDVNTLILQHHGIKVFTAATFQQGVDLLQYHSTEIDCILLDVMLPDMEAPESVEKIREQSNLPIILSSGYPPDEAVTAVLPQCGGPFLQKPYRKNVLLHTIKKFLNSDQQ
ncbi:response regulator [candidate division KSB1 bacterium]|nr:response regulator [candidate division KSB1 bacterium]